ncbi:uncharacterized protein LOC111617645 [Centruroides sculpturatus]|uniref:uncharacterized protein LOC111617645 n=1 Tax=Centruroides sculpturatus TaxID=218467 RepID=UPI000C6EB456|nr:uncharacterized protein LOC111617645 [Centruroides sculpturatus]
MVYFSVASASPLESVTIYYQRYHHERYIPRPRQCKRCRNFGHSPTTCRGHHKCITCGADHDRITCTAAAASCVHCGGEHSADSPRCPAHQQKACLLKFSAIQHCSYLEAKHPQSNSPKSYARVASTSPPKLPERTPCSKKQPALSTIGQTDDILTLTNRISQLESIVEKLCAKLSLLRSIIQPTLLNQTQGSLREPSLDKELTVSISSKCSFHPMGSLTPAQLPKKKKGPKPRSTDPLAASDSEDPNSDMDHTYSTGSTRPNGGIWRSSPGRGSPTTIRHIEKPIHEALRTALGVPKSTPLLSLYTKSGYIPFQSRLHQKAISHAITHLSRGHYSPLYKIFSTASSLDYYHWRPFQVPYASRVLSLIRQEGVPISHLYRQKYVPPSPTNIQPRICLDNFPNASSQPPAALNALFNDLLSTNWRGWTLIGADASKSHLRMAFGVVLPAQTIKETWALHTSCSVFSAEALDIQWAVNLSARLNTPIAIVSDGKSVLQAVTNVNFSSPVVIIDLAATISSHPTPLEIG